jgi:hypothetical protein
MPQNLAFTRLKNLRVMGQPFDPDTNVDVSPEGPRRNLDTNQLPPFDPSSAIPGGFRPPIRPVGAVPGDIELPADKVDLPTFPGRPFPFTGTRPPGIGEPDFDHPQPPARPSITQAAPLKALSVPNISGDIDQDELNASMPTPPKPPSWVQGYSGQPKPLGTVNQTRMEADVTPAVKPSPWHFTTPAEHNQLETTRREANTYPALEGLKTGSYQPPPTTDNGSFMGTKFSTPSRNQAAVDFMRSKLGLEPEAPGVAGSQAALESVYKPESEFRDMLELLKAKSPLAAAQIQQQTQLGVEGLRQKGYEDRYNELMNMMRMGGIPAGQSVSLPGGGGVRNAPASMSVPQGAGGPAQQRLQKLIQERNNLPAPGSIGRVLGSPGELISGVSQEQRRQQLDQEIEALQKELGMSSGQTGPSQQTVPNAKVGPPQGAQRIVLPSGAIVYREQ